jgi:hypothetical protein
MKYFTKELFSGSLSDKMMDTIINSYWEYIDSIFNRLPFILKLLSKHIYLHDGIIQNLKIDNDIKSVKINILGGDLENGYFSLILIYSGVIKHSSTVDSILEIRASEIELIDNGNFIHRILSNKGVIETIFSDLELNITTKTATDYKNAKKTEPGFKN